MQGGSSLADQVPKRKSGIGLAMRCDVSPHRHGSTSGHPAGRLQDILGVNEERDAIRHRTPSRQKNSPASSPPEAADGGED